MGRHCAFSHLSPWQGKHFEPQHCAVTVFTSLTHILHHSVDHSSYYTRANSQSAALLRARRPYLVKNAITGLGVAGIAVGVCTSISPRLHSYRGEGMLTPARHLHDQRRRPGRVRRRQGSRCTYSTGAGDERSQEIDATRRRHSRSDRWKGVNLCSWKNANVLQGGCQYAEGRDMPMAHEGCAEQVTIHSKWKDSRKRVDERCADGHNGYVFMYLKALWGPAHLQAQPCIYKTRKAGVLRCRAIAALV